MKTVSLELLTIIGKLNFYLFNKLYQLPEHP